MLKHARFTSKCTEIVRNEDGTFSVRAVRWQPSA
jgi:hypothetical protein